MLLPARLFEPVLTLRQQAGRGGGELTRLPPEGVAAVGLAGRQRGSAPPAHPGPRLMPMTRSGKPHRVVRSHPQPGGSMHLRTKLGLIAAVGATVAVSAAATTSGGAQAADGRTLTFLDDTNHATQAFVDNPPK